MGSPLPAWRQRRVRGLAVRWREESRKEEFGSGVGVVSLGDLAGVWGREPRLAVFAFIDLIIRRERAVHFSRLGSRRLAKFSRSCL